MGAKQKSNHTKCHMAEPYALLHEVFAFIYILEGRADRTSTYPRGPIQKEGNYYKIGVK